MAFRLPAVKSQSCTAIPVQIWHHHSQPSYHRSATTISLRGFLPSAIQRASVLRLMICGELATRERFRGFLRFNAPMHFLILFIMPFLSPTR